MLCRATLVNVNVNLNQVEVCIQCIVCTTHSHTHLRFMSLEMKKIPSEMEVTPRYKQLTLFTLFTLFKLLYTA